MAIDMTRKLSRPPGHHTLTPGFAVPNASGVISFLEQAFGAELIERYDGPNGKVAHAELRLGDSAVMLGEAPADQPARPAMLSYYVDTGEAVDRAYRRALDAGARTISEPGNMFYGYRSACVQDPGGNRWTICAVVEDLSKDEIVRRMKALPA